MRILLVEDDLLVVAGLKQGLEHAGFTVDVAASAEVAQSMLKLEVPALAIVDLGLPGLDGTELIRWMRRQKISAPVMVLTARDTLEDTVMGFDVGADDYLVKPFRLPEIIARSRALIRRSHKHDDPVLRIGKLAMDTARHTLEADGDAVDLSPREWAILEHLMLASPKVVSKDSLLLQLASWDEELTLNAIEVHVSRLRHKLPASSGIVVRTVRGHGYRIEEAEAGQ